MSNIESQIESSLEQLQMDERLRSNLIDAEAKVLLDWATTRLMNSAKGATDDSAAISAIKSEAQRVRSVLRTINDQFASDQNPAKSALVALGITLPDRSAFIQWLLDQVSAAWAASA